MAFAGSSSDKPAAKAPPASKAKPVAKAKTVAQAKASANDKCKSILKSSNHSLQCGGEMMAQKERICAGRTVLDFTIPLVQEHADHTTNYQTEELLVSVRSFKPFHYSFKLV